MSPKLCLKFGFDIEQATVLCCILEFFFAYVHILVACFVVLLAPMKYIEILTHAQYNCKPNPPLLDCAGFPTIGIMQWVFFVVYVIYFVGLLVQAAFSIPLYLIGYKKKNPKIITAWIIIAAINYTCPGILFFGSFAALDLGGAYSPPTTEEAIEEEQKNGNPWMRFIPGGIPKLTGFLLIYMFYLDFPVQVFWAYRKHLIKQVQSVSPAPVPDKAMEMLGMKPQATEVQVISDDPEV